MATRFGPNTDHWSKMRMNLIKNSINYEQRGRVLNWQKHQKIGVQRELEAAIRGARDLPKSAPAHVHNFQDILTVELNGYLPGTEYIRRRTGRTRQASKERNRQIIQYPDRMLTASQYTLMTPPSNAHRDYSRSRVPVTQCRGRI